jgi:glutathione reductase (NADPH)
MSTYDLVIIGSGTAAQAAGSRVRRAGWTEALVDHRPFGGTSRSATVSLPRI